MLTSENYELAINQSIQSLLDSLKNPNPNLSLFTPTFLDLMQAKPNPPLETIWVFSALTFNSNNSPKDDLLDQLSAVKDLFQSITACSASCSSSVCIALIAPVIFKLHKLIVDLKGKDLILKREKKARREIRAFLDVLLGHFSLCCCEEPNGDEDSGFVRPIIDLVSVWVHAEGIGDEVGKDRLRLFFPILSDEIVDWINEESGGVSEILAGAVILEAFLLKLYLKFGEGMPKNERKNELRTWVVCSITGLRNFYFFDMLIKMLLEPTLSVTSLLSSEDELFIRKMLYDAVILADYSFLHPEKIGNLPKNHIKNNILARLMMTHEAVEFFRKNGDHSKAVSYTHAFSGSHLPTFLVRLVTSELGTERAGQPNGSSPTTFLKWVLDVVDQGVRLSDDFVSKHSARLVKANLKSDLGKSYKQDPAKKDQDLLFFIDNKGKSDSDEDDKMNESVNEAFVAAARAMQSDTTVNGKKRKETSDEKKKDRIKFQRVDFVDRLGPKSGEKTGFFDKHGSGSMSKVEDPNSSEDSD